MNKRVILYIAMSLDGYIADINGNVNWIEGDNSIPNDDDDTMGNYTKFIDTVDTILMGFNTYEQIVTTLSPQKWPYEGLKSYVFTNKRLVSQSTDIEFTNNSPAEIINTIRGFYGKNIWVCGGAILANEIIKENLIDEYHITIIPTILGDGISLFKHNNPNISLRLISTDNINGLITCKYAKRLIN